MRVLSVLALLCCAAFGAEEVSSASVEKLLAGLASPHALSEARQALERADIEGRSPNTPELIAASDIIAKAQAIVPKLRSQLKVGTSVLSYPGLLAHGDLTWDSSAKEYTLYFGVFLKPEGRGPYDFNLVFDSAGTIRSVNDVVWKR